MKRVSAGVAVKPTWLLMMTWTVPPVRYAGSSERLSVSGTIPCPVNAASPWIRMGTTRWWSRSPQPSCLARDPFDDRIDQFQVAGIGAERAVDFVPLGRDAVVGIAEVVFDVAFTLRRLRRRCLGKLAENDLVGLMDDVAQHVQPAAMGHAHHDFFRSDAAPSSISVSSSGISDSAPSTENRFAR